jgi:hypothetical protein
MRSFATVTRDGVVGTAAHGQPIERFRRQTVRQVLLVDPVRGTRVSITVPREEIYVVPVRVF